MAAPGRQPLAYISVPLLLRVAPTFVLKYNIRAVRALGSAWSDLAGLDEVIEGGAGDVEYLGDRGLGDILAQQRPNV